MIFGETHEQRQERMFREARRTKFFAWLPTRLDDGRYAWLRTIFRRFNVQRQVHEFYVKD